MAHQGEHPVVFETRKMVYTTLLGMKTSSPEWSKTVNAVADMCDKCRGKSDQEIKDITDAFLKQYPAARKKTEAPSRKQVPAPARGAKKKTPPKPAVKQRGRVSRVRRRS